MKVFFKEIEKDIRGHREGGDMKKEAEIRVMYLPANRHLSFRASRGKPSHGHLAFRLLASCTV